MPRRNAIYFPLPRLVCDIGGTHIRFASVETEGGQLHLLKHAEIAGFPDFVAACSNVIPQMATRPASLLVCAAGPVEGCSVRLTNANWSIDGGALAAELRLQQGLLLNDFEALALGVATVERDVLTPFIRSDTPAQPEATRLVLGAGTGLGTASLSLCDGRYHASPSEAGHIALAAQNAEDEKIFAHVTRPYGRLTAETIISGPGLQRLHKAQLAVAGRMTDREVSAAEIAAAAYRDASSIEAKTIRHFWRIAACFAGDMALAFSASGGTILAGGVFQKMSPLLDMDEFRGCFQNKPPMNALMASIPVSLLEDEYAVLRGLARIGANPENYSINFGLRSWV